MTFGRPLQASKLAGLSVGSTSGKLRPYNQVRHGPAHCRDHGDTRIQQAFAKHRLADHACRTEHENIHPDLSYDRGRRQRRGRRFHASGPESQRIHDD